MKAVIETGGKQYIVAKDDVLNVELLTAEKKIEFEPLLTYDGDDVQIGAPGLSGVKVTAEVVEPVVKGEKVKIRKFQAKKRVNTLSGHRQKYTQIKITGISTQKATKKQSSSAKQSPAKKPAAKKAKSAPKKSAKK